MHVDIVWRSAASLEKFQDPDRSTFCGEGQDLFELCLNPLDHAVVVCVDEKTQIQARERAQPALRRGLGHIDGVMHDYVWHGTSALLATLVIANGQVLPRCRARYPHHEFPGFLKHYLGDYSN